MTPIVVHVRRRYRGGTTALDDVSTALQTDTITGLLGRNGAGKSTLMRIITGQEFVSSGSVRVDGQNPLENDAVLGRMMFVKESQVYPDIKVKRALEAASWFDPGWDAELADQLMKDFDLPANRAHQGGRQRGAGPQARSGSSSGWPPGPRSPCSTSPTWGWMPLPGRSSTTGCSPITPNTREPSCCPPT